jgi:transposase
MEPALPGKCRSLRPFYDRLRADGKSPKEALVACMRKLLTILNAIVRDQTPWQPASVHP